MIKLKVEERQRYEFYDGRIILEYDPVDHIYLRDGVEIPSVTQIVKIIDKSAALINWAVKLTAEKILASVHFPIRDLTEEEFRDVVTSAKSAHRDKLETAGNIGKIAHSWIENNIKLWMEIPECPSLTLPSDEKAKNCCIAALDWMAKHQVRWIHTERKVYSEVFDYAGTLDGIALVSSCQDRSCCPVEFKDRLSLIDWKSSNALYNEYIFQTAAYQQAYEEETGEVIEDRWVIRLGKDDGEFEAWHFEDGICDDFLAFEHCLELTKLVKSVTLRMKDKKSSKKSEKSKKFKLNKKSPKSKEKERNKNVESKESAESTEAGQ